MENDDTFAGAALRDRAVQFYTPSALLSKDFENALLAAFGSFTVNILDRCRRSADGGALEEEVLVYRVLYNAVEHRDVLDAIIRDERDRVLAAGPHCFLVETQEAHAVALCLPKETK